MRGRAPRGGQPVDVLVALEHADEERLLPIGERARRAVEKRVDVDVGRKRRSGLGAVLPDEPGRRRRERPYGIGPPESGERKPVGERIEDAPQPRAVQPRDRAPVAVHLEHDRGASTGEPPPEERGAGAVRPLGEDGVRLELAELAGDEVRERGLEEQAVELPRAKRRDERERLVALRAALGRAGEDADVELRTERGELPLERGVERQRVARAADEQHTRSRGHARQLP
jgi:hypothetical protein